MEILSMLSKGQWTVGHVYMYNSTTTDLTNQEIQSGTPSNPQQCYNGSAVPDVAKTCNIQTTTDTGLDLLVDYGLFGNIKYQTSTNVTNTYIYTFYDSYGHKVKTLADTTSITYDNSDNNPIIQNDYTEWAICNKTWINNIRATQAFLVISLVNLVISFLFYYWAIYKHYDHQAIYSSLRKGFYWLLLSSFNMFVCYLCWIAIPRHAFLNAYVDPELFSTSPSSLMIFDVESEDYTCIQLTESYSYTIDPQLNRHGIMWQLVFFCWFFCLLTLYIWRRLFSTIKKSPFEIQNLPGGSSFGIDYTFSPTENFVNIDNGVEIKYTQNSLFNQGHQDFKTHNIKISTRGNDDGPVVSI